MYYFLFGMILCFVEVIDEYNYFKKKFDLYSGFDLLLYFYI